MFILNLIFLTFLLSLCSSKTIYSNRWPNHDISTLKLLQIVHRHGDRTPTEFSPNDPFKSERFWREGFGQLTNKGKYRMYKLGQFIRHEYQEYLGDNYSPREVYARSGLVDRCIESLSLLLSGAYPPRNKFWQWNYGKDAELGQVWQPFPIETFMPMVDDLVLEEEKPCPAVDRERAKIYNRTLLRTYVEHNKQFYMYLSMVTGAKIVDIPSASYPLFDTLTIELEYNRYWSQIWTKEEEEDLVNVLSVGNQLYYQYNWDSPTIQRIRAGGLVGELTKNINSVLKDQNNKKIFVYSTHDNIVALLMHSLNIFNGQPPPYGATLLFELHKKREDLSGNCGYFLRAFYHNETVINSGTPHPLRWRNCGNVYDCPIDQFFDSTEHLKYENFDEECNR